MNSTISITNQFCMYNRAGRYKTNEDFIQLAPCTFSMAKIWKDRCGVFLEAPLCCI